MVSPSPHFPASAGIAPVANAGHISVYATSGPNMTAKKHSAPGGMDFHLAWRNRPAYNINTGIA
jgi:hypothetical protein